MNTLFKKIIKHYKIINVFLFLSITTYVITSSYIFYNRVKHNEERSINDYLCEIAMKNTEAVKVLIDIYKVGLNIIQHSLTLDEDIISSDNILLLEENSKINHMDSFSLALPNGYLYTSNGLILEDSSYESISSYAENEMYISNVTLSKISDESVIRMGLPLYSTDSEKPIAALFTEVSVKNFISALNLSKFYDAGYFHVVDLEGNYVAYSNDSSALLMDMSFFDAILQLDFPTGYSANKITNDIINGQPGFTKYSYNGNKRYCYYAPVGINNWTMMTIIPSDVANKQIALTLKEPLVFIIKIICVLLIIFIWIITILYKNKKNEEKMLMLELEQERIYKYISFDVFDNVLEADISNDVLIGQNSKDLLKSLGLLDTASYSQCIDALSKKIVKEEFADEYKYKLSIDNIKSLYNTEINNFTYEFIEKADWINYKWTKIDVRIYYNKSTDSIRIISFVKIIDDAKKKEVFLLEKSQKDSLTSLYNKRTTEEFINDILKNYKGNKYALLMIDIDDFKAVNDNLGHAFGDKVIMSIANSMRLVFHHCKVLGRIGGDEFVILVENYNDIDDVKSKAELLLTKAEKYYKGEITNYKISISIGIALAPNHGTSFQELYKNADTALYASKLEGKNRVVIYEK